MAASKTGMAYNLFQNGKYGGLPQNLGNDMELTQDMHLKMSKKIAQLTKVIYALNTKNDEHENVVQCLKEQHEEEIQKILSETKDKIAVYKAKIDGESEVQKRVKSLEESITDHEKHRLRAITEFENFKKQAAEREIQLKTENAQKILELSQDVLKAKRNFEEKINEFEKWKKNVNEDKEAALNELRQAHEKEVNDLRNFQHNQSSDWLNEVAKLEDKYKVQIEDLKGNYEKLMAEKNKLIEDYDLKLSKAQAFYEKELDALRQSQNQTEESAYRLLQERQEQLRKDFAAQEAQLKKQIDSLVNQLTESEDLASKYKRDLEQLLSQLQNKDQASLELGRQLHEAKQQSMDALTKLKTVESELIAMRERCAEQSNELLKKSGVIGELEAVKLQNHSTITSLQTELSKLNDRLAWLEKERKDLERQKSSLSESQRSQLQALERALEDMSVEKQTLKEKLEREIESLKNRSSESEKEREDKHKAEIDELKRRAKEELNAEIKRAEERLLVTKEELTGKYVKQIEELQKEKEQLKAEYEKVRSELSSRLQSAEDEVMRLSKIVQESEQGLGSASSHISNLKEVSNRLQAELNKTKNELKDVKIKAADLQAELDKLKMLHDTKMKEASAEQQRKLEQLSKDLELKWSETLRSECAKLRQELTEQKEKENRAALQHLASLKDEEIAASKAGWEKRVNDLMKQIAMLKENLQNSESKIGEELERFRREAEAERKRLEQELLAAADEYANKISIMEEVQLEKIKKLKEQNDQEMEEQLFKIKEKHVEDMQAQMTAHKVTVESIASQAEKQRAADLQVQQEKYSKALEDLRSDLVEKHSAMLDQKQREHEAQIRTARMELERAVEISKSKERDHQIRVEELQGEITHRERHIINLKEELRSLESNISKLNKDIASKEKEIQKVKSDTKVQLKNREEQLLKKYQAELDNLQADHIRESQELVTQFNQAQELLKDKISELQIQLEEAEERYQNRESRPEDLELIEQLRESILEKEQRMKQLIDEKRYFQMELVNRETNFNKVFNASPNVGVLNPLHVKAKKGDKAIAKFTSSPNFSQGKRLDPLPGSPLHTGNLNPSKPLPSPAFNKKFVK
ncbi:hypothetical protein ACJMK2_006484 [Sinanodonta woodiana]|uniref:Protein FAM184A/B N-terminal domain-containing protein n=1 Tax=Sinanodonta woodiana TaxID=1069815 RepID=A0ABD3VT96_SINWO